MTTEESAGGIVLNSDGEAIVVNQNNDSWSFPKGHIEPGEDRLAAARREVKEESGVSELEFIKELGHYSRHRIGRNGLEDRSVLKKITWFLFYTKQRVLAPTDPHNPEARWVKLDQVAGLLTHPKDKEFYLTILPKLTDEMAGQKPGP